MTEKKEQSKKIARKKTLRNAGILIVALLLVGGLVLSAMYGFIDHLARGGQPPPTQEGDQLESMKQYAESLEQSVQEDPDDMDLRAELGYVYYQIATLSWQSGEGAEGDQYADKSKELLVEVTEEGYQESWAPLTVALLSMYDENQDMAESYFDKTLEMDDENPEVHLYYGIYLSSIERMDQAREHWDQVLELADEESQWAQMAEFYLEMDAPEELLEEPDELEEEDLEDLEEIEDLEDLDE